MMHRLHLPLVMTLVLSLPALLHGQDDATLPSEQQVNQALEHRDYSQAESLCRQLLAKDPSDQIACYNLACALARQGRSSAAITALATAQQLGFADADHARSDADLASLHDQAGFTAVIADMSARQARAHEQALSKIPYEAGAVIAGTTSIEGNPASGLRWRIRMGADATKASPERLILWLHPSGASANSMVEALAPELNRHGFALAVFTQKQFQTWQAEEMNKIWPSIQDMNQQPGIDASHPVLMGFSAGGQTALLAWSSHPELWSALLLDAAYPIDLATMHGNQVSSISVTPAMRGAKVPILALVGSQDPGSQLWQAIAPKWVQIGLPVTLRVVPGRKHEYLFNGADWTATVAFLDALPKTNGVGAHAPAPSAHDDPMVP